MFKLVIQDDEGKTTVVPLIRDEITIGRKEGNTIRLTERNVSRRHARILRNNGEVHIEDLGSYNGIRVNNARIAERVSLRVSDQVQIGDYKLYLKAEGVEQVDDARTMPIERVDTNGGAPTEVIPAIAAPAVTAQVAAVSAPPSGTPVPPPAPAPPQLIGNPARTMVAISGDDASGRPIATAAVVAALTQPVGHGKLVVLSSNFAGKEFELTRGQMIIGRTDENDIVVNHRSISRNHAKIVREPETQRYTISDLQSSNGVRVNGQDYGKVELRRGDVVDLGHVRLRFIEPGEDFVFARDAVITDVPESGSKRGMLVAIILGVIVLGAAGAFLAMHNTGEKPEKSDQGSDGSAQTHVVLPVIDAGDIHVNEIAADAAIAEITPPDATSTGMTMVRPPPDDHVAAKLACQEKGTNRDWDGEITCANDKLRSDPAAQKQVVDSANAEKRARTAFDAVAKAASSKNIAAARLAQGQIPATSVYAKDAADAIATASGSYAENARDEVERFITAHNCGALKSYLEQIKKQLGNDGFEPFRNSLAQCQPAQVIEPPIEHHPNPTSGSGAVGSGGAGSAAVTMPPPTACDADAHQKAGEAATAKGSHPLALTEFEASLKCRRDAHVTALAYMEACASSNALKAKIYYAQMPATGSYSQSTLLQMCMRNGLDPRPKGSAP